MLIMPLPKLRRVALPRARGFTVIELMVVITVFGILVLTAVPAFGVWMAGAQVRAVSEGLQDGLSQAKAEAVRRNRSIQFVLTDSDPLGSGPWTASASGRNWVIVTVPRLKVGSGAIEAVERIAGNTLLQVAQAVTVSGPATLNFNSYGMVTGASGISAYNVSHERAERALRVQVSVGGQIRSCDIGKSIADNAEGC